MELNEILTIAVKAKGSDIHIKTGLPPIVRIDGRLHPIPNAPRLSPDFVGAMSQNMMTDRQRRIFEENSEVDLAYAVPGLGRFRVSVYRQRGTTAMVFRSISFVIPSLPGLNLPQSVVTAMYALTMRGQRIQAIQVLRANSSLGLGEAKDAVDRLAEVVPQWPIVGRSDMYYGGTTYQNRSGLGVQLSSAALRGEKFNLPRLQKPAALRPRENKLLAVPITKLYDRGITLATSTLLAQRIGEPFIALHPSAAEKLGVQAGQQVNLSLDGADEDVVVRIDHTIPAGVALVPRSMGLPISEPAEASVKVPAASAKSKAAAR